MDGGDVALGPSGGLRVDARVFVSAAALAAISMHFGQVLALMQSYPNVYGDITGTLVPSKWYLPISSVRT